AALISVSCAPSHRVGSGGTRVFVPPGGPDKAEFLWMTCAAGVLEYAHERSGHLPRVGPPEGSKTGSPACHGRGQRQPPTPCWSRLAASRRNKTSGKRAHPAESH